MLGNCLSLCTKQIRHLLLREPDGFVLDADFDFHCLVRLIEYDFVFGYHKSVVYMALREYFCGLGQ